MDPFNWMVLEIITEEAMRERLNGQRKSEPEAHKRPSPVTRALASSLVRLGLRLDPAAAEGRGHPGLALAGPEARR